MRTNIAFMLLELVPNAVLVLLMVGAVAWALVLVGIAILNRHPLRHVPEEGDRTALGAAGLIWIIRTYARFWHRLDAHGMDSIPELSQHSDAAGRPLGGGRPTVVIANHTAGIDPLLIQASIGFEPRWMMAADMRARILEPLWLYARIIFVDRTKRDSASLREALRHLKAGGVLGVFIEGHIAKPPRHLLPFKEGAGLLIKKTGALVIPVVIDGTPEAESAWGSIFQRSHSKVRFLEPVDYTQGELAGLDPADITADLRRRFQRATGWPDTHMQADFDEHGRLVWSVSEEAPDTVSGESATLGA
jgi:1-acyl-sn-glycerol-3-phosphate acyltransferase